MAEGAASYVCPVPESGTQFGRDAIQRRLVDAFSRHASEVFALEPGAPWSSATEAAILSVVLPLNAQLADVRYVRRAIARVLERGRQLGRWQWKGSISLPRTKQECDRFSVVKRADVELAAQRRSRLLSELNSVLTCGDTLVLKGALIVAAVDLSAVLVPELLERIPNLFADGKSPVQTSGSLVWINLPLGKEERRGKKAGKKADKTPEWKNDRHWILDDVGMRLCRALSELPYNIALGNTEDCLKAFAAHLDLPALSLATLLRTARARWAIYLDEAMYRYATTMVFAPSLPDGAFRAYLDGTRRRIPASPGPLVEVAGVEEDDLDLPAQDNGGEGAGSPPCMQVDVMPLAEADLSSQLEAVAALKRIFGKFVGPKKPQPTLDQLRRRFEAWNRDHRKVGGWVVLMADWARAAIDSSYLPGSTRPGEWQSIHRYLSGFAAAFLSRLAHLPPDRLVEGLEDELDAFADGFELLRDQLAGKGSASTDKQGLRLFLHFVRSVGGPQIHLDSSWRIVVSACDADANILTERDYANVLAALNQRGPTDSYPVARARVMTILAFRLGLRWEELQTRRLGDLKFVGAHATLWVRPNPYFRGKTRASIRTLPIELLLTPVELEEVRRFTELAKRHTQTRAPHDFLFADAYDLTRPPATTMTHEWIVAAMRHETGDPTLVFHHLRHSAATHLFARLMLASAPPWAVADWKRTRGTPADWAEFARKLTGREPTDASRLFVISRLLGHSEPTTTMRYYIHLADLVLAASVHRERPCPTAGEAERDGIEPNSVYRARMRARDRREGHQ